MEPFQVYRAGLACNKEEFGPFHLLNAFVRESANSQEPQVTHAHCTVIFYKVSLYYQNIYVVKTPIAVFFIGVGRINRTVGYIL